jgi:PAT family beta-lactamase induction signal transducer AmpG
LFYIKDPGRGTEIRFQWSAFKAFKNTQVVAAALCCLIVFLVVVGANQLMNPAFTERFGIDLKTAGLITTVWGIGCVAGAFIGGAIKDKLGDKSALWVSLLTVVPAMLMLAFVPWKPLVWAVAVLFGISYGLTQSVYFALAMKYTVPSIAASMFSIMMAVTNVGQGIGLVRGGALANSAGYPITFVIFGAFMFLILPFFPVLFRKKAA